MDDRTAMLVIELSTVSERLWRYGSWLRSKGCAGALPLLAPSARTEWWVYFGTINADRIDGFAWTGTPCDEAEDHVKAAINAAFGGSPTTPSAGDVIQRNVASE
jgi:hypothetical protein